MEESRAIGVGHTQFTLCKEGIVPSVYNEALSVSSFIYTTPTYIIKVLKRDGWLSSSFLGCVQSQYNTIPDLLYAGYFSKGEKSESIGT